MTKQPLPKTSDIDTLIGSIEVNIRPNHRYYGKLIKWKKEREWFYGIGLSDNAIFDTRNLKIIERGIINITSKDKKEGDETEAEYEPFQFPIFVVKPSLSSISPSEIIDRLKYVLLYIQDKSSGNKLNRETWNSQYDKKKWNDEHLSRFITNKKVISRKKGIVESADKVKLQEIEQFIVKNNPDSYLTIFKQKIPTISISGRFWLLLFVVILAIIFIALESYPLFIGLIILVLLAFKLPEYEWSGFQNKQLWNWLELLFVPILLTIGGFYLQQQAEERQERSDQTKAQNQSLMEYFKNVKDIIKTQNNYNFLTENNKKLIESFTKTVLSEINADQKRQVVKFLYDLRLIRKDRNNRGHNLLKLDEADFSEAKLNNLDLSNLYLPNVNLTKVDFTESDLARANLKGSKIEGVNIDLVNLRNATVVTELTKFSDQNVQEKWDLIQKIQSLAPLTKTVDIDNSGILKSSVLPDSMSDADREGNRICKKTLKDPGQSNSLIKNFPSKEDVNLSNVNLEGLDFSGFNFKKYNLKEASFKNSVLTGANFRGVQLDKINWEGAYLKYSKFGVFNKLKLDSKTRLIYNLLNDPQKYMNELGKKQNKDLENANLSYIQMINEPQQPQKVIKNINLTNSKLLCSKFSNLDMSESNLSDADLSQAQLTNIDLSSSNLNSVIMNKTKMKDVDLTNTNLFYADLTKAEISGKLKGANLNSAILRGADLSKVEDLGEVAEFWGAAYDKKTKFPKNFKPENHYLRLEDDDINSPID